MKRSNNVATENGEPKANLKATLKHNGHPKVQAESLSANDLSLILGSLQTMRDGDFSVRLPGSWTGGAGKNEDTVNVIVGANQEMARETRGVVKEGGEEARTWERMKVKETRGTQ